MKKVLLFVVCAWPLFASAQIVISTDGILSITPGATFYAAGDFINKGKVLNNGSLNISGAWTNNGDYQAEGGQVNFNGTGPQIINHNAQSFAKLVISGGGEKVFKADITIQNEIVLDAGVLSTDTDSKIILAPAAIVTGGSATSFIQGAVHSIGNGSKLFPVGINGTYLPVVLTNVTGTAPEVGVMVLEPNTYTTLSDKLQSVSALRYWSISNANGAFTGSPVTVTLANDSFSNSDNIVVAQSGFDGDPFVSIGRGTFAGSETSGSVTSENLLTTTGTIYVAAAELKTDGDKHITVYNAVTPNGDDVHDYLKIVNIDGGAYPNNQVTIVNRWGDKVFEMQGYNNSAADKRFNGDGNIGAAKTLTDGTYFYVIDPGNGDKKLSGFLILKR